MEVFIKQTNGVVIKFFLVCLFCLTSQSTNLQSVWDGATAFLVLTCTVPCSFGTQHDAVSGNRTQGSCFLFKIWSKVPISFTYAENKYYLLLYFSETTRAALENNNNEKIII